jgi:hypothetical protein
MSGEEDLIDYSDEELEITKAPTSTINDGAAAKKDLAPSGATAADKKGSYVGIHSTGFRDFLLKPELLRAITDCGFEHPSEGQSFSSHHRKLHPPYSPCHYLRLVGVLVVIFTSFVLARSHRQKEAFSKNAPKPLHYILI